MSDEVEGPGRVVTYPAGMTTMVFAMFGVQSVDDTHTEPFVAALRQLFAGAHGPRSVERCHHHDDVSGHNTILMAYWTDLGEATAFLESAPFSTWWEARPTDDDRVGYWREILTPQVGRFHYFGVGPHRVGATAVLPVSGTDKFGYWGGYRDRMADSPADPFDSPLAELPTRGPTVSTRGRRVTVDAPHNLCFVREGADTSHITSHEEQQVWDELLEPASKKWITYLAENPRTSGCAAIVDTVEQDLETGADLRKASQLAYFLTLGHLEHAARTQPSHLALYNTFMGAATDLADEGIEMGLFIWAEAHILRAGELRAEYVNCHPRTGLLPFFARAAEPVSV